jgi:nitrite reductase/ring-hydroxylating ferredoxin subunit
VFHVDGHYFAVHNSCAHQSGPVCEGGLFPALRARIEPNGKVKEYYDYDQTVVACPWHGWEFDIATGQCLGDPKRKLRTYRIEVQGDDIVVRV